MPNPTPTGTVTVMDGSSPLGTFPLIGGNYQASVTFSAAGDHAVTVVYSGDANYDTATSDPVTITVLANKLPATVQPFTPSPNPVPIGAPVQILGSVSG